VTRSTCAWRSAITALARAAAPLAVLVGFALAASPAGASPTALELRIEGRSQTLFEGLISSEGHPVMASSDTAQRSCDGVNPNDPENTVPGATPTAAGVDAMGLIGETFDGTWYSGLDDYLITRWGPQRSAEGESWFLLVNSVLSSVGGCQLELHEGARVLWAFEPSPTKLLALYPAAAAPGAPPLTATAALGVPFALQVAARSVKEGKPPASAESAGYAPYAGASISPVATSQRGVETVQGGSPETVLTNGQGNASITFNQPGWHRLKASAGPGVVRSNRLDVCVPAPCASGCGPLPSDDLVRNARAEAAAETGAGGCGSAGPGAGSGQPGASTPGGQGQLDARGLRIGGLLLFPFDARARALHYRGRWRFVVDARAWHHVVAIGRVGATLTVHLGRGRPVFIVRDSHRKTRLEISAGGHSKTFTVPAGAVTRLLLAPRRARAGTVRLRVLAGAVGIDGAALIA
jgi:hypothetical protein